MRVKNEDLLSVDDTRATVALTADRQLKPIWLGHIQNYSIQLKFTGTPAGAFKLQASNDEGRVQAAGEANKYAGVSNWTDVADSEITVSAAGDCMWDVQNAGYNWVRVVYTASGAGSGTPTLTIARAYVKGA